MTPEFLMNAVEAALLAARRALAVEDLVALFEDEAPAPTRKDVKEALTQLDEEWKGRAVQLVEVASGFRMQVGSEYSRWISRLWADRPPRYTRALLETLALIAYRQPVTRGEIEDVRGVSVSSSIVKTLLEREWIRVLGHRDVPGRPALYGTTKTFLDNFGLKSLEELPPLGEIKDIDNMTADLFAEAAMQTPGTPGEPIIPGIPASEPPHEGADSSETDGADTAGEATAEDAHRT